MNIRSPMVQIIETGDIVWLFTSVYNELYPWNLTKGIDFPTDGPLRWRSSISKPGIQVWESIYNLRIV